MQVDIMHHRVKVDNLINIVLAQIMENLIGLRLLKIIKNEISIWRHLRAPLIRKTLCGSSWVHFWNERAWFIVITKYLESVHIFLERPDVLQANFSQLFHVGENLFVALLQEICCHRVYILYLGLFYYEIWSTPSSWNFEKN